MLDEHILNWSPAVDFAPEIRSFGRFGPCVIQTKTFGSSTHGFPRKAAVDELPNATKTVSGIESPKVPPAVKTWRLAHANARIRQEAKVSHFASCEGAKGALHAARMPSSSPCEDESDARTVAGRVYAGIYDGHGGWATARTLKTSLVPLVANELSKISDGSSEKTNDAITTAFNALDDSILNAAKASVKTADPCDPDVMAALAPAISGSCALLSIFEAESATLRVACVGDSRAVLGRHSNNKGLDAYETEAVSIDQTGENKDEILRVENEHPGEDELFSDGRLLGIMVTRAFGDHRWKWEAELSKKIWLEFLGVPEKPDIRTPPYLTAEPVITCTEVSAKDFVILASDGLWEHMTSEDAVLCVAEWLNKKKECLCTDGNKTPRGGHMEQPEHVISLNKFELDFDQGFRTWKTLPQHFVVEDMDNAAVHLLKNALGGKRRNLFVSSTMMYPPHARGMRDDITVQVLFFGEGSV